MESEGTGHWVATATLPSRPVWQARFGEHTPTHLIAAFTTALADPIPLPRTGSLLSTPTRNPNLVTRTHEEVPVVQVASALEERVHALAARRADPPASPSTLRRPPTNNGRSR
ncbi:DUF317 domain-containing protein [Streptomyces sp. NPDC056831]|uniref:DUF317 domain-containing protein n=1 Tax=Streptomyces sp. NPDC056831 TaxID=3345954 RepID=UPI0036CB12C8